MFREEVYTVGRGVSEKATNIALGWNKMMHLNEIDILQVCSIGCFFVVMMIAVMTAFFSSKSTSIFGAIIVKPKSP